MLNSMTVWRGALVAALLAAPGLHAAEVAGVRLDDSLRVGNRELVLNGAGLRSKLFIKLYVGALYVPQKSTQVAVLLDNAAPRRMALRLLRDVDAESLHTALDDGLKANLAPGELAHLQAACGQLAAIMQQIGKVREGQTVAIDLMADGVAVSLNGQLRGQIAAPALAPALLKVWLGDKPADPALKKSLLGG